MTDEADFQAALDANPEEHTIRLVFADWLEERGDPRAEGYRALGVNGKCADKNGSGTMTFFWMWLGARAGEQRYELPGDWFDKFYETTRQGRPMPKTRRECESSVALAFAKLPESRRAELLGTLTPA